MTSEILAYHSYIITEDETRWRRKYRDELLEKLCKEGVLTLSEKGTFRVYDIRSKPWSEHPTNSQGVSYRFRELVDAVDYAEIELGTDVDGRANYQIAVAQTNGD